MSNNLVSTLVDLTGQSGLPQNGFKDLFIVSGKLFFMEGQYFYGGGIFNVNKSDGSDYKKTYFNGVKGNLYTRFIVGSNNTFYIYGARVASFTYNDVLNIFNPFTLLLDSETLINTYYRCAACDNTRSLLYLHSPSTNNIISLPFAGGAPTTLLSYYSGAQSMCVSNDGNFLYINKSRGIDVVTLTGTPSVTSTFDIGINLASTLSINASNTFLFYSSLAGVINCLEIATGTVSVVAGQPTTGQVDGYGTAASFNQPFSLAIDYGTNTAYVVQKNSFKVRAISMFNPDAPAATGTPPCFKEGTKILTDKGYVPIETLRSGDKVQTFKDGFVPIHAIGKRVINNPGVEERIAEQLYVCSPSKFPEVFEDLVITGYHSLLSKNFESIEQEEQAKELLGKIYITDGYYRIPICIDKRAEVYKEKDSAMIYHFALEHQDYYMNYGVYANGLLVESTSKRYLLELSGMELI
jgi:hypothetical protein